MAELFIATSPGEHGFQKKVVIKRLLPQLVSDATYNAMFIDEAKLTARLVHPKIAQTFELGKVDEQLYVIKEASDRPGRDAFRTALSSLQADLGGYRVHFGAQQGMQGSQYVDMVVINRHGHIVG